MRSPLDFPESDPAVFKIPYSGGLKSTEPFKMFDYNRKGSRLKLELSRRGIELNQLISNLPSITKKAGYTLLSKFFTFWMNTSRSSNSIEIDWSEIEGSDDLQLLKTHIDIAKGALEFSLKPKSDQKTPNLIGVGEKFKRELKHKLTLFANQRQEESREETIELYGMSIDSYRNLIHKGISERLKATYSVKKNESQWDKYYELLSQINQRNNSHKLTPFVKNVKREDKQYKIMVSKLFAALGRFNINIHVTIQMKMVNKSTVEWHVSKITYKLRDSFDFEKSQLLGIWSNNGITIPGTFLTNQKLRDYGKRHELQDFKIFSQKSEEFSSAKFTFRKKTISPKRRIK